VQMGVNMVSWISWKSELATGGPLIGLPLASRPLPSPAPQLAMTSRIGAAQIPWCPKRRIESLAIRVPWILPRVDG